MPSDLKLTAEQIGELERLWAAWMRREPGSYVDVRDKLLCHGPELIAAAKATTSAEQRAVEAEERVREMREALIASHTDIGHWLQLARYQREKMDQNLGWCPTEEGIVRSEMVRSQISTALAQPPEEPRP